MIRRLFRLIVLAAAVAGVVAVIRAMARTDDPLPAPAAGPSGGVWPPLRDESPAVASAPPKAPPVTGVPTERDERQPAVVPEPGGTPVAREPDTAAGAAWVAPAEGGNCPPGHPIKAKMTSKIFHAPGQLNYERTTPDRCYVDAAAAEADGLRPAKR